MKKLKSMTGLAPQVIENISEMFEKFPHDNIVSQALFSLVSNYLNYIGSSLPYHIQRLN